MQAMIRAFRRAQIPLVFSQGFHPLPKISFGPPLPVGYESKAEFLDYYAPGLFPTEESMKRWNRVLPQGIHMTGIQEIPLQCRSIFDSIIQVLYDIHFLEPGWVRPEQVDRFGTEEDFPFFWEKKKKMIDLKKVVASLLLENPLTLKIALRPTQEGMLRPEEALKGIFGWPQEKKPKMSIQKSQALIEECGHVQ